MYINLSLAHIFYLLDYVTLGRISKGPSKIKQIKIKPEPKLYIMIALYMSIISVEHMLIRMEVNFSIKH